MPAKSITRVVEKGTYSYIYNKAIADRFLFKDDQDYKVFVSYLSEYLTSPADSEATKRTFTVKGRSYRGTPHQPKNYFKKVELVSYSLMPTHFHLVLYQTEEKSIESFIRSLCTRYSMYYNKKYQRTGALFEGPYKSAQVKNATQLLYLSAYIHINSRYSSYLNYTGEVQNSWVKPTVALSALNNEVNYKSFMEKYQFGPKEQELLAGLIPESEKHSLERRDLAAEAEIAKEDLTSPADDLRKKTHEALKTPHRIPEFMAATGVFFILLTLGIGNINASPAPTPIALIPSNISLEPSPTPQPTVTETPAGPSELDRTIGLTMVDEIASESATILGASENKSIKTVGVIKIDDGSPSVNVRSAATTYSEKISVALPGEEVEILSEKPGWYEVKLHDGTTGFIVTRYISLEQNTN